MYSCLTSLWSALDASSIEEVLALSSDPETAILTQLSQMGWQDFGAVEEESAKASHLEYVNALLHEVQRADFEVNDSLDTERGTCAFSTADTYAALADDNDAVVILSRRERGKIAGPNSSHVDNSNEAYTCKQVKRPRLFEPNPLVKEDVQKKSNASTTAAAVPPGQFVNPGAHAEMASNANYNVSQEPLDKNLVSINFPANLLMKHTALPGELELCFSPPTFSPHRLSFNGDIPSEDSLLSTFLPLSFDETQTNLLLPNLPTAHSTQQPYLVDISDNATRSQNQVSERFSSPHDPGTPVPNNEYLPGLAVASPRRSLYNFLDLRSRTHLTYGATPHPLTQTSLIQQAQPRLRVGDIVSEHRAPPEVYDEQTIVLPISGQVQHYDHCYLASLDIITKSAFTRSLASPHALVGLVERESLDGADIIVDPNAALLTFSLFGISSSVQALTSRLLQLSDRFENILVVFEAYLPARALKPEGKRGHYSMTHAPNVFSPAVLKAIHKLRRDLAIAEACGQKCPGSTVFYAFAHTVDEAARFVRLFGDYAQQLDRSAGLLWGRRQWLTDEEDEVSGFL